MKKWITLFLALCAAACLTVTAWADYDYIDRYAITAQPNVDDGSIRITVELTWTALEELPYGQELKIGIPNGSLRDETALTDNIEQLAYDNSYMYVYLDRGYDDGETFSFAYSWVQEYMYTLGDDGSVSYDYTPGWFDEAKMGEMTLTWYDPEGVAGTVTIEDDRSGASAVFEDGAAQATQTDLGYGDTMHLTAVYPQWPVALDSQYSAGNYQNGDYFDDDFYYTDYVDDYEDTVAEAFISLVVFVLVFIVIVWAVSSSRRSYRGGFGTRYVFVNHLWYPAGPDGRPRPGSVGVKHRPRPPKPPRDSGFGGGSRGGGFGGGGFGGGGHCACASSCACACACACAGGGRAGCSAKNIYRVTVKPEDEP